jgi:outer membrane biosynthesis protein TonB
MISAAAPPDQNETAGNINRYPADLVIPSYPVLAQRAAIQGAIECEASVVGGRIYLVEITKGNPIFKDAVTDAIKQWQYDSSITERVKLKFEFHLVDDSSMNIYAAKIKMPNEIHLYAHRLPLQLQFSKEK